MPTYSRSGKDMRYGDDYSIEVFEEMPVRDVVFWNSMISMVNGEVGPATRLFDSMPKRERDVATWNFVVTGLSKAGKMELARSVFERMLVRSEVLWNSMVSRYVKVGDVKTARNIFYQMPEKSVVSSTALITGYTIVGNPESVSYLFYQMPVKCSYMEFYDFRPDAITLVSVLSVCSHLGYLEYGKWIYSYIKKNTIELSNPLGNTLIDMFAKGLAVNGQCREALDIFDSLCSEGTKPDDVIFIAALTACTHGGSVEEGKTVYNQMVQEFNFKPWIEHYGRMVDLLGRAGKWEEATRFIESLHLEPNTVIWASLLGSCRIHGKGELLELFDRKNLGSGNKTHEFVAKDTRHEKRREIFGALDCLYEHLKQISDTSYVKEITDYVSEGLGGKMHTCNALVSDTLSSLVPGIQISGHWYPDYAKEALDLCNSDALSCHFRSV
ncbi:unnamed protein product [Dovyalis caffra]|uniref:Pentatricopeptide repeat-containing protein n=1 Tax=Dovyalis caffra TaxID=77055 RepID=A0AAV1S8R3_9ROSI|nr:unnamed protein product [Dovyalis caffra]